MASLWARLPAEEALACYRGLCELAAPTDEATDAANEPGGDGTCGSDADADSNSDSDADAGPGADPVPGGGSDRGSGRAPDQAPSAAGLPGCDSGLDHAGRAGQPARVAGRLRPDPPLRWPVG